MRWESLFEDLEAQLAGLEQRERAAEVAEHTRAERGQVALTDRLVGAVSTELRLRVGGVGWLRATLLDVGTDWVLLDTGGSLRSRGSEALVPVAALTAVEGLTRRADTREDVESRRFGLRHALRTVSRDRAVVRVHDRDGDHVTGTVDRVLADHLDLTRHADDEPRRAPAVRGVVSLPYAALSLVRRL
ncbi:MULTISPECIES: hypothetical protein [unclassified Ornithinimicrobium]|uniref:hypothetical protein n=1 Tax=unclassified Ornithinimicrobium TaxID=2615080 RepID=UPI00385269D2